MRVGLLTGVSGMSCGKLWPGAERKPLHIKQSAWRGEGLMARADSEGLHGDFKLSCTDFLFPICLFLYQPSSYICIAWQTFNLNPDNKQGYNIYS